MKQILTELQPRWYERLGQRGRFLITMGIGWVFLGGTILYEPVPRGQEVLFHAQLPAWPRAVLWILSGLIASIAAFRTQDTFGFLALYPMPAFRAISYFWGWAESDPLREPQWWWALIILAAGIYGWHRTKDLSLWRKAATSILLATLCYSLLFALAVSDNGNNGYKYGWLNCGVYTAIVLIIVNAAGWKEPKVPAISPQGWRERSLR